MAKRIVTRIGNVFCAEIDDESKLYRMMSSGRHGIACEIKSAD